MNNWEALFEKYGLKEANLTVNMQTAIAGYRERVNTRALIVEIIGNPETLEPERQEAEKDLIVIDAEIEGFDKDICKRIETGQRLGNARKQALDKNQKPKAAADADPAKVDPPVVGGDPTSGQQNNPAPPTPTDPNPPAPPPATPAADTETKDSTGMVILGVALAAIAAIFGFNYYKNRQ